jgi:PAS domain S-box-containing protein
MSVNIAVILTDAQKKILWVNDAFTFITGYTPREAIGSSPGKILQGPESEMEVIRRMRKALDEQVPVREEISNYRKNGEIYPCRLVIYPVFDQHKQLTNFIAFEVDGHEVPEEEYIPLLELNLKYKNSGLSKFEGTRIYEALVQLLEREKIYLDPDLSLKQTADRLMTNTKYLSQVVNQFTAKNFQQFVNTYRIEAVKSKINDPQYSNLTLYGISLYCGFKNKSTFYKVFKEITGLTPKIFMEKYR